MIEPSLARGRHNIIFYNVTFNHRVLWMSNLVRVLVTCKLKRNKRICMISYQRFVSSQGTKEQQLDFGDGPDYDPDPDLTDLHETFIRGVSLAKDQSIKLWE